MFKNDLSIVWIRQQIDPPIVRNSDYHLNFENGVFAIEKIRWQIDKPIKAILATADRSEQVAKICTKKDIILMHKPLKPAILRAILTRVDTNPTAKQEDMLEDLSEL